MTRLDISTAILGLIGSRGPLAYTTLVEVMKEFSSKSTLARRLQELEEEKLVTKTPRYEANQEQGETTIAKDLWMLDQKELIDSQEERGFRLSFYGISDQPYVLDEEDIVGLRELIINFIQKIINQNDPSIPGDVLSGEEIEPDIEDRLAKHGVCIVANFDGIQQITIPDSVIKAKRRELIQILNQESPKGIALKQVGVILGVTRTALIQVVKPLERAGLVELKEGFIRPLFRPREED